MMFRGQRFAQPWYKLFDLLGRTGGAVRALSDMVA
jgi:hypothetical protein